MNLAQTDLRKHTRPTLFLVGMLIVLAISITVATAHGTVRLPYSDTLRAIIAKVFGQEADPMHGAIIWSVRLPRVVAAGLVGLALAVAGTAMQGLFRNPLASPDIIGVASGGSLGAVIAILLQWQLIHTLLLPLSAFVFAAISVTIVYMMATRLGRTDMATLLLAGIAVSSLSGALISLFYHFVDDGILRQIVYWLMGNLAGKRWDHVALMAPFIFVGAVGLWTLAPHLNLLLAGEDEAKAMGVPVQRTKLWVLTFVSLMTGAAVSVSGTIGFVGLIIPHAVRLIIGPDHKWLIPAGGLAGAAFLILADLGARTFFRPIELRTGIITAVIGVPFFLYLLVKRRDLVRWN